MDELMSIAMTANYSRFCQRYYCWQQVNQPSSVVVPLSTGTNSQSPKISGKKRQLSEKEQQEMKIRRMMKNRESAARSRARKLAFIKELENKVCQLEELIKSLGRIKEFNLKEQNPVSQEEARPQLRRTNSAPHTSY